MNFWVARGKRHLTDWAETQKPGVVSRWFTRKSTGRIQEGDGIFFWKPSPDFELAGLGRVVELKPRGADGEYRVHIEALTSLLTWPIARDALRTDPALQAASFLKAGPVGTFLQLQPPEAQRLFALASLHSPAAKRLRWFARSPSTTREKRSPHSESRARATTASARRQGSTAFSSESVRGITRALLIREGPLERILKGTKTWEIRGANTHIRGPIGLIQSASGQVVGTCNLVDVIGPLSLQELRRNAAKAGFRAEEEPYRNTFAWVVSNARRLPRPVSYRHPAGAIIWVRLEPQVRAVVEGQRRG